MSVEATSKTIRSYLDAFLARGDFADYFTEEVTWTTVGAGQELQGRQPVHEFLMWMHTQAFDAHPKVKTLVLGTARRRWRPTLSAPTPASSSASRPPESRSRCPTAWSTTCRMRGSRPCGPTSPWTSSPNNLGNRSR
jgi:hypothetical protein